LNPDFDSLINMYDILLFTETKTDKFDVLKLPNGENKMSRRVFGIFRWDISTA
jgi:hypothetical protein